MLGWSKSSHQIPVDQFLAQYLTLNGDGTGTYNMASNYSVTPDEFYIQAPAGTVLNICDLMLLLDDNANFRSNGFAGIAAPLTNGFGINVYDDTATLRKTFTPVVIKTTKGLSRVFHALNYYNYSSGDNYIAAALNFSHDHNSCLPLLPGWKLGVTISDDLSTLVELSMLCQGWTEAA